MYVVEEDLTECSAAEEVKVPLLVKIIYARLVVSFVCCSLRSSLTCRHPLPLNIADRIISTKLNSNVLKGKE